MSLDAPSPSSPPETLGGYTLFDTPIGRCGIAWGAQGIVAAQLPDSRDDHLIARLRRRLPTAIEAPPPPDVQRVIERVKALLQGKFDDLVDVPLDLAGLPSFQADVYAVTRRIPPGDTLSYGEVAKQVGPAASPRDVGQALGRNPFAPIVPCHRVLAAGGKPGGFSATGGVETKLKMLAIERPHGHVTGDLFGTD